MNMMIDTATTQSAQATESHDLPYMMVETVYCDKNGKPRARARTSLSGLIAALAAPLRLS